MSREELISYCLDTTNAERKRRGIVNPVPREVYESMSDDVLEETYALLKLNPRNAEGGLVAPWEDT